MSLHGRNVSLSASSTRRTHLTHTSLPINNFKSPITSFIKSRLTYVICCLGISFDAAPSTPPPPGLPQSTGPGEGSAPASPSRRCRVHTSSWIRDGAHAKDLSRKIFSLMLSFKIILYSCLLVNESSWEKSINI